MPFDVDSLKTQAKQGDESSQFRLAVYYLTDVESGPQLDQAHKWLSRAARNNYADAKRLLAECGDLHGTSSLPKSRNELGFPTLILVTGLALIVLALWALSPTGLQQLPSGASAPVQPVTRAVEPTQRAAPHSVDVPVLTTCSSVTGWQTCSVKKEFRPGEEVFMYAEARNINRGGRTDVVFHFTAWAPGGTRIFAGTETNHVATQALHAWAYKFFQLSLNSKPGLYRLKVHVRNNLTGQVGGRSTSVVRHK